MVFSLVAWTLTRTTIYIDGYNLYYSRLKGTPYKWLDIAALFRDRILLPQDPGAEVVAIKYFTAPVKASYARHGEASVQAQTQYLRALQARDPGLIQIVNGFHVLRTHIPAELPSGRQPEQEQRVARLDDRRKADRRGNLALHAYRDAVRGECDQLVICSNDSDVEPALRMLREDVPAARLGLVMPLRDRTAADGKVPNKRLTALAHWVRHHIRDDELAQSQLPLNVQTRKKPASKPAHW